MGEKTNYSKRSQEDYTLGFKFQTEEWKHLDITFLILFKIWK